MFWLPGLRGCQGLNYDATAEVVRMTAGQKIGLVAGLLLFTGWCVKRMDGAHERGVASPPPAPAKSAEQIAADKERTFRSNVEYAASKIVEDEFTKRTWGEMPENFYARGETVKRDGANALVHVRTGVKKGMLSEPVWIKSFLVALKWGDPEPEKYTWRRSTAIATCDDPPTDGQVSRAMLANAWPGAMSALIDEAAAERDAKKSKRRRRAATEEE